MADLYEVTEGIESTWHYHLSIRGRHTFALCGRKTMKTSLPLSQFGKGKAAPDGAGINGRWCQECQRSRADEHYGDKSE